MKSLIINYKAYKEGFDRGIEIALAAGEASGEYGLEVTTSVPFTLCRGIAKITRSISQGLDPVEPGASTGKVSWYEIAKSGCVGSLINHSENRISHTDIDKLVKICNDHSLSSYVCVESMDEARKIIVFRPTALAYEPKELIGGDISVAEAKPEIVKAFCDMVHKSSNSLALIGAGIKTAADVEKAVGLGADGVLVSSVVMKGGFRKKIDELAAALVGRDLPR